MWQLEGNRTGKDRESETLPFDFATGGDNQVSVDTHQPHLVEPEKLGLFGSGLITRVHSPIPIEPYFRDRWMAFLQFKAIDNGTGQGFSE